MKTEEKAPDNSIMQEFMDEVSKILGPQISFSESSYNQLKERKDRLITEAHADWIEHYNHADLTPLQARELARIYFTLFFAQEEYLRLNKEWIKYK
jgi:hypothetical protein